MEDLAAGDFDRFRSALTTGPRRKRGSVSLAKDIRPAQILFKYAYDAGIMNAHHLLELLLRDLV